MSSKTVKTARTFIPFDGGLSPVTDKTRGVPLFGNTPLIQDLLNGETGGFNDIKGRGSWSSEKDDVHSFHEKGSEYRLDEDLLKLDIERAKGRKIKGRWIAETEDGNRYEFESKEVGEAQLRLMQKPVRRMWRAAVNTNLVSDVVSSCVEVISKPIDGDGGVGAAFCIAPGKFITCAHVIMSYDIGSYDNVEEFMSKNVSIQVTRDGKTEQAKLVSVSLKMDIALLESDFPSTILKFSNSRDHLVGESVIAVGSPKGFENSVSKGILSGLDRVVFTQDGAPKHMFTDAKILPGNSGGPLVSEIDGTVIGMVEIIVGEDAPYGLNAAIQSEYLLSAIKDMNISI